LANALGITNTTFITYSTLTTGIAFLSTKMADVIHITHEVGLAQVALTARLACTTACLAISGCGAGQTLLASISRTTGFLILPTRLTLIFTIADQVGLSTGVSLQAFPSFRPG